MITIDIAQRDASRSRPAPMVTFRRTDADRRPARRFAQPNDGPAPDRLARAEAARRRLDQPKPWMSPEWGKTPKATFDAEACDGKMRRYLDALRDGPASNVSIANATGENENTVRHVSSRALRQGLVVKLAPVQASMRRTVPYALTDAGRAYLAGGGDDQR